MRTFILLALAVCLAVAQAQNDTQTCEFDVDCDTLCCEFSDDFTKSFCMEGPKKGEPCDPFFGCDCEFGMECLADGDDDGIPFTCQDDDYEY